MGYRKKECACGCGRVGYFSQYATNACRQKAYRRRKRDNVQTKYETLSSFLVDLFGIDDCQPIFENLNQLTGKKNVQFAAEAIEQIVYLTQSKINQDSKKARRVL